MIKIITLILGNVGSGKTASMVRMMKKNQHKNFITNINVKGKDFKHCIKLKAEMILKRTYIRTKTTGEDVHKLELNTEFWKELILKYKTMNVVIDEAHQFFNPRRSMSKINIIMTDFLSLLRRVLGSVDGNGTLYLVTQLSRRLDIISKEMSTDIQFCIHHYIKQCGKCGLKWSENNESSIKFEDCPKCKSHRVKKIKSQIEVFKFQNIEKFMDYYNFHNKTYYARYYINDIHKIFNNYDTLQFDDLLSQY